MHLKWNIKSKGLAYILSWWCWPKFCHQVKIDAMRWSFCWIIISTATLGDVVDVDSESDVVDDEEPVEPLRKTATVPGWSFNETNSEKNSSAEQKNSVRIIFPKTLVFQLWPEYFFLLTPRGTRAIKFSPSTKFFSTPTSLFLPLLSLPLLSLFKHFFSGTFSFFSPCFVCFSISAQN